MVDYPEFMPNHGLAPQKATPKAVIAAAIWDTWTSDQHAMADIIIKNLNEYGYFIVRRS